ncbi:MAG: hypothetical protein GY906_24915 [bacterium]|nr:hypothetical protein [bacterium]
MKQIICPNCNTITWTKKDKGLVMGRFSSGQHPTVIKCARCCQSFKMQAMDFAKMPEEVIVVK